MVTPSSWKDSCPHTTECASEEACSSLRTVVVKVTVFGGSKIARTAKFDGPRIAIDAYAWLAEEVKRRNE